MEIGSNEDSTYIAKFNVKNKPMYVKVLWKEDDNDLFHVKVFYEEKSWVGNFSNVLAAKRAERLDEPIDEYNADVKKCLSGNSKNYAFDFTPCPDDLTTASFIWKKQYEGAIKLHGLVSLQCEEVSTSKDSLIDILLEKNKQYLSEINIARKEIKSLQQDLLQYTDKIEELIECKNSLEATLYGCFVQVLNKKKERIQILQEHIDSL